MASKIAAVSAAGVADRPPSLRRRIVVTWPGVESVRKPHSSHDFMVPIGGNTFDGQSSYIGPLEYIRPQLG
jgi:hypothetical protein